MHVIEMTILMHLKHARVIINFLNNENKLYELLF